MPMSPSWRPPARIRVKTFGLHWNGDALLAAEITRDDGTPIGVRPLGGNLNFGEPWVVALRREFREELGVELSWIGPPRVIENIFEHEGATGHEVVFVADVEFADKALDAPASLEFAESDGTTRKARWYPMAEIRSGRRRLLPAGLETAMLGGERK
ncbi:MAG: NUDIX domain-containing protein [Boseongicola sp.]|nr:NUDIX domain-containing protein [Boseongicola sp.]